MSSVAERMYSPNFLLADPPRADQTRMDNPERLTIPASGLKLQADVAGPADGPTILFLHGSGQTRQSWGRALSEAARRGYRGISLDLRGHGDSDWSPDGNYDLAHFTADVRQAVDYIGGRPILVGASLGGLASMLVVAEAPAKARALVLVDITPRVEMSGAKEVIAFMDSAPDGFASVEEAADAVAAYLPHRERPANTNGLKRNLRLRNGRYYWHWDPAMRQMSRAVESKFAGPNPLESAARALTLPTLLVRGGRSRIVSETGVREFLEMVPHAEFVDISGAHHMVAGDANDAFNEAVFDFVARQI
jgi:pimeloyl-ACP methyl ester carboxylesterase